MSGFQVETGELADAARALAAVAERLREVATAAAGIGAPGAGGPLLGGLEEALERAVGRWRSAQQGMADAAEGVAERLGRAAVVYDDVDRAVVRSAGG